MGLATLLNIPPDIHHHTVFVTDQQISPGLRARISEELVNSPTRVHFLTASDQLERDVARVGIRIESDYVSLHCWATCFASHQQSLKLLSQLRRFDFSRLEFPAQEVLPYESNHLESLLGTMLASNYKVQDAKIEEFYTGLARRKPYEVEVHTGEGNILRVQDSAGWFQLGGSLIEGESRILPSGEVAYTGAKINGRFTADGTLLAAPQRSSVASIARRLSHLRGELSSAPLTFTIADGKLTGLEGNGELYEFLGELLETPSYREVVEVGIGLNQACRQFVESWPSPANEAHPGAHIALGGDPDPGQPDREVAVHIDWMAANSRIIINGEVFDCGGAQ
jgi:leucyl aminopeptidase (aminopeptidase T)